jgi:hypothetical protein
MVVGSSPTRPTIKITGLLSPGNRLRAAGSHHRHIGLIDDAGEVRELEADDLALFRPTGQVLPASLRTKLGVRDPQKAPTK